jgi:hypothetical protein
VKQAFNRVLVLNVQNELGIMEMTRYHGEKILAASFLFIVLLLAWLICVQVLLGDN